MEDSAGETAKMFVAAINRQDVEALCNLMTQNHRFVDSLGGETVGRETVRAAWLAYFQLVPDYTIRVGETYRDGQVVVMLGAVQGTLARGGEIKLEDFWTTPAAIRARVENDLVAEWRVYADNEPIREKMRETK
jgi:ketosteroid isomerase-like protein